MKSKIYARQGDVALLYAEKIPSDAKPVDSKKRHVLAEGEVTGHLHAVSAAFAQMFQSRTGEVFLKAKEGAELVHGEAAFQDKYERAQADQKQALVDERKPDHAPVPLIEGVLKAVIQREWSDEDQRLVED